MIDSMLRAQFTTEESAAYNKIYANVDTFMPTNIPKFIRGDMNIESDEDWNSYCRMLGRYGADKVTQIYQRVFDSLR